MKDIDDTAVQEFRIQGRIVPALTSSILGFFFLQKIQVKKLSLYHIIQTIFKFIYIIPIYFTLQSFSHVIPPFPALLFFIKLYP